MGSFEVGCALSGIPISSGDPVLLVLYGKRWKPSHGVMNLLHHIHILKMLMKEQRETKSEQVHKFYSTEVQDHNEGQIFKFGTYNDYGWINELPGTADIDDLFFLHAEVANLCIKPSSHHYLDKLLDIATFAASVRRELISVVSTQYHDLNELDNNIKLYKLCSELTQAKYEELREWEEEDG